MSEQLRNKLKDPLFIVMALLGVLTLIGLVLFGGWILKSIGGLFGIGSAAMGRRTLRKWAAEEAQRDQRNQALLEHDRLKRKELRKSFHSQARDLAAREAQTERAIEQDKDKTPDAQREALLRDAKKIDGTQ